MPGGPARPAAGKQDAAILLNNAFAETAVDRRRTPQICSELDQIRLGSRNAAPIPA
jgi:hypothetical protein